MKIVFLSMNLLIWLAACHTLNEQVGVQDDHIAEELTEEIIKHQTGLSIDLTPESPE